MNSKHVRLILQALRKEMPDCEIAPLRQRVHHVINISRGDLTRRLVVSVSPKNVDHAVMSSVREAKKLMKGI